jgi:hypothetical protein
MLNLTAGPARERIDAAEAAALRDANVLVTDDRRLRPLYFDGRFLAARDLTREQNYFLMREADLGLAVGSGVTRGLMVARGAGASMIRIAPGHGITTAGELVLVEDDITINLADVALLERLNRAFGLLAVPHQPLRSLSGLYIIALRPVEYTANPIASYPTSIDGKRTIEDGDTVEGVAVTLIPYPNRDLPQEPGRRRARVARQLFVGGITAATMSQVLPLAMASLTRSTIDWLDPFLVRREVGAEHGDILGLNLAPRALREAHALQYDRHLLEVIAERHDNANSFQASDHFEALPPAGRMPVSAINTTGFTQSYFPSQLPVELSIVPSDEIPALLEESLQLPPIDLTLGAEEQESTSVLILAPVARQQLAALRAGLGSVTRTLAPAAPALLAQRRPLENLRLLRLPRVMPVPPVNPVDVAWKAVVDAAGGLLWYARRRDVPYRQPIFVGSFLTPFTPAALPVGSPATPSVGPAHHDAAIGDLVGRADGMPSERDAEQQIVDLFTPLGLDFARLQRKSTAAAMVTVLRMLSATMFQPTPRDGGTPIAPVVANAVVADLNAADQLDVATVLALFEPYQAPGFGEGLLALAAVRPNLLTRDATRRRLISSRLVPAIDRLGRTLQGDALTEFAGKLFTAARSSEAEVKALVAEQSGQTEPGP